MKKLLRDLMGVASADDVKCYLPLSATCDGLRAGQVVLHKVSKKSAVITGFYVHNREMWARVETGFNESEEFDARVEALEAAPAVAAVDPHVPVPKADA